MRFVFLDDGGGATSWSAASEAGRIHAVALYLGQRIQAGAAVGLLFRSGVDLVRTWFACINAGLRPLVLQYPTRKQSRAYWYDSIANTIGLAALGAVISDDYSAGLGFPASITVVRGGELPVEDLSGAAASVLPDRFSILQLSSGTTGYRKAMEFHSVDLRRHAEDYNKVLGLTALDRIASWLPLYHDMGYVACFVMPILLDVDVVMMDPVTWVQKPELLFDMIEQHGGTICYMPNFAYEVMARGAARSMPGVRRWISCSEPVSVSTSRKFLAHVGAPSESFSACYAMAENLFAVTIGTGIETRVIDGTEVISCGQPIPGVALKTSEGEIWVRSPTSLAHYLDGKDIRDADGYYPTGDLGQILDGELYVVGRKQDILIQAGRKFMLSDMDLKLNDEYSAIRGRAVTLAVLDVRLGTETPLILIEAMDFYDRTDGHDIAARMMDVTGIDQLQVAFVPPRFLTKTSSGKFNRKKTLADWIKVQEAKNRKWVSRDPLQELQSGFAHIDWSKPMKTVLDSLSMTLIQIILQGSDIKWSSNRSLEEVAAELRHAASASAVPRQHEESIRIVSLADRSVWAPVREEQLEAMQERLGCKVTVEHICMPPLPVVFSDLIFHDYFQPRLDQDAFAAVDDVLERIKNASVIVVDNQAEMKFLYSSVYPVLSHNLERDPRADLLSFRWQSYTAQHDKLPVTIARGLDVPLRASDDTIGRLERYLGIPIFRVATLPQFDRFCDGWDFKANPGLPGLKDTERMVASLLDWLLERPAIRRVPLRPGPPLVLSDPLHFCGLAVQRGAIDLVVDYFDSFYVAGQAASLPYLRRRIEQAGKPYTLIQSYAPEILDNLPERRDCLLICGPFGEITSVIPTVAFQHTGPYDRIRNVGALAEQLKPFGRFVDMPVSGTDWYHAFDFAFKQDLKAWQDSRAEIRQQSSRKHKSDARTDAA